MKSISGIILGIASVLMPMAAHAEKSRWVEITRTVPVCENDLDQTSEADDQLAIISAQIAEKVGVKDMKSCSLLHKGDKLIFAHHQPLSGVKLILYCHNCAPYLTEMFAPPLDSRKPYLRPTTPPTASASEVEE